MMIGAVIPCYKGNKETIYLVRKVLNYVDIIVLVDDACPNNTGKKIKEKISSNKLKIIFNDFNYGVGASMKKGFEYLIKKNVEIIIKIDADGQMLPEEIPLLINPLLKNESTATKGNRFTNLENISKIPRLRLLGMVILGIMSKFSTGYWELFDSTNGFWAIKKDRLKMINLKTLDDRYFFETDLLFRLGLLDTKIIEVGITAIYGNIESSLNPIKEIPNFAVKHISLFFKRIFFQYFIFDQNIATLKLIGFLISFLSTIIWTSVCIYQSNENQILTSPGAVGIAVFLSIVSFQLIISFFNYDSSKSFSRKILNNQKNLDYKLYKSNNQ